MAMRQEAFSEIASRLSSAQTQALVGIFCGRDAAKWEQYCQEVLKNNLCERQHVKDTTEFENAPLSHVLTPLK